MAGSCESFPEDSLADDAALESARSYRRLWRKPQLDPMYGETALASYNTLIGLYPTSPLIPVAQKEIAELENWFAIKDYDAGMYYFRRKCFDCGMIYFKDVLTKYANSPTAHDAALRLVESYKAVRYRDDAADLCAQIRQRYPNDPDVRKVCAGVAVIAAAKPDSVPPVANEAARALSREDRAPRGELRSPPQRAPSRGRRRVRRAVARPPGFHSRRGSAAQGRHRRRRPPQQRLAMVRLLVDDDPRFDVSAIEIDRGGLSYTVDTLAALAARWPSAELFWLVGADVGSVVRQVAGARSESSSLRPS